ncbi:TPA: replication protein [Escherichia coli]|uniref:replication protein n=1 Tax=Escherichia coli TaxID=562 RepID=UPI0016A70E54|nr:replication protein [Escherichia coli]EFK1517386.1 replication protein [Escherichia coli]EGM9466634.1 replication protein [Escherichia coli]ELQ7224166.1 replication protein [Escherichia coli]MCF7262654.1 replication protein [Escherichia coli]HBB0323953.1 replication protein [Escherichia coli]
MENQKSGYVPLYRSIKKKSWAKDVFLRALWENLLIDAARQPYTAFFKGKQWPLQPGQLVVTAADLGLQLCDRQGNPTSRDAVERMLSVFVREGMISIEGEKRKGRVITITNYVEYAQKMDDLPAHKAAHTSAHDEASDGAGSEGYAAHKPAQLPAHHEQEGNNKNINNLSSENSDESSDARLKKFLSAHPDAVVHTPSGAKWGTAEDLKTAQWISTRVKVINPSCKAPDITSWSNTVRLMRQIDNRSHQDICALYDWASKHHFWQTNVLSPESLRKQWDKLTMQRNAGGEQRTGKPDLDFNNTDWAYGVMP